MKLFAFDGDHTLWTPLDGVNLCDRSPTDSVGNPNFTYAQSDAELLLAVRDDGARFRLRAEAPDVLQQLRAKNVLCGVISYNHEAPVRRILQAFHISGSVNYVIAEWHTGKDKMLMRMLREARREGHSVRISDALLVDDDPYEIYRGQYEMLGANFLRFGVDVTDLREVLPYETRPASHLAPKLHELC